MYLGRTGPLGRQAGAQAEQSVDGNIKMRRWAARYLQACCQSALTRGAGIDSLATGWWARALRVFSPSDADLFAEAVQHQRCFKTIAAVVAGAAGDPDVLGVRRQGKRLLSSRQARPLHEGVVR